MATMGGGQALTLTDWKERNDPDGKIAKIIELLNDMNPILADMMFVEGNLPTGHKTTVRSGLPSVTWRLLNYGVVPSKSRTVQVTDSIGMLEAYAEVDKSLADLNGNTAEFRLSEDMAFIEKMNQEMATTVFYGNTTTDPEKFMGLAPRYDDITAENAENLIDGEGQVADIDCTSIWLVLWGANTVHGIYPKGSTAGLSVSDKGQQTLLDGNGGKYEGYRTHYKWDVGLTVRDWRYVVRIHSIVVDELLISQASGAKLVDLLTQAVEIPPNMNMGRAAIYCNKTIRSMLRRQINNTTNVNLYLDNYAGKKVVMFDGIPVHTCDAITNDEVGLNP